jgi:hypothetical protein
MRIPTLALAAMVVAAACGTGGTDPPPEISGPPPSPSDLHPATPPSAGALLAEIEPVPASAAPSTQVPAVTVLPAAAILPRSMSYAMLDWTVTDAVITNQDPASYVVGMPGPPTATTSLIVDFDIRNDDVHVSFASTTVRLEVALPDGTVVRGTELIRSSAPPVSSVEGRYAFEVPAGTAFEGLRLRIEDPGRVPSADLPLSGPAPEAEVDASIEVHVEKRIPIAGIDMRWTVDRVLVGNDWPLPIGFTGGTLVAGARAEIGFRWFGIVARVDVGRCACKGGVLDQTGSARLLVDGLPYAAAAAESSSLILNTSTYSDVMLVFAIPSAAQSVTLQVGPLEKPGQQATLALDLGPGP